MKDFYGSEVKLGDKVVCMVKDYRSLMEADVIKITDKTVLVEYVPHWTPNKQTYRLTSDQFIVVGGY
jgi:hypothetical protein